MDKQETWNEMIDFYEELISKYNWKQEPMLEFVNSLKVIGFWDKYFASGSHSALGLSLFDISENFGKRIVYIEYQSKIDNFQMFFQQEQKVFKELSCGSSINQNILNQIDDFLLNSSL
jgi:hypothetical protein